MDKNYIYIILTFNQEGMMSAGVKPGETEDDSTLVIASVVSELEPEAARHQFPMMFSPEFFLLLPENKNTFELVETEATMQGKKVSFVYAVSNITGELPEGSLWITPNEAYAILEHSGFVSNDLHVAIDEFSEVAKNFK